MHIYYKARFFFNILLKNADQISEFESDVQKKSSQQQKIEQSFKIMKDDQQNFGMTGLLPNASCNLKSLKVRSSNRVISAWVILTYAY